MSYEVESGIPIPSRPVGAQSKRYPFGKMEVGDSFSIPIGSRQRLSSAASWFGRRNQKRFSVLKLSDTEARCWRIA